MRIASLIAPHAALLQRYSVPVGLFAVLALSIYTIPVSAQPEEGVRYAERMPLADDTLLLDGTLTDTGAVLVGERGHILLSGDFREWRQAASVPTRSTLTAVEFVGREGWAVGHDAVIVHTSDGGEHWDRQYFAPERQQPLMDVYFVSADKGYAVGAYGLYLTTQNGGETWQEGDVSAMDDWHHYAMLTTPTGTILIAGERGIIYRSDDGGSSYEAIQLPYEGSMFGLLETAPGAYLAFGLRGHAFESTDDGITWQPVNTGTTDSLFGGRVLPNGTVILVGNGGTLVKRAPGGGEFRIFQQLDGEALAGVLQDSGGDLYVFGVHGVNPFTPAGAAP